MGGFDGAATGAAGGGPPAPGSSPPSTRCQRGSKREGEPEGGDPSRSSPPSSRCIRGWARGVGGRGRRHGGRGGDPQSPGFSQTKQKPTPLPFPPKHPPTHLHHISCCTLPCCRSQHLQEHIRVLRLKPSDNLRMREPRGWWGGGHDNPAWEPSPPCSNNACSIARCAKPFVCTPLTPWRSLCSTGLAWMAKWRCLGCTGPLSTWMAALCCTACA